MPKCTPEAHQALKENPLDFRSDTVFIGYQKVHGGDSFLELRNCRRCQTTLTLTVEVINHDWILLAGTLQLRQLSANVELVHQDDESSPERQADISAAHDHLTRALLLFRRHLPEGFR